MNGDFSMKKEVFDIRIIRSPWSDFYGQEIEDCLKTHPDSYLKEVSREGFNAVWLHCILRNIVDCSAFPEFGKKKKQIPALNKLVEKAGKYGLKVYLYFCEPRGFRGEDPFWKNNPDVKGQPNKVKDVGNFDGTYFALCSSTQKVKDFLYESSYNLFSKVPGLGGVFMITASEFHTHCYSHFPVWQKEFTDPGMKEWKKDSFQCSRCVKRKPSEVAAEIITLVNRGIKDANPQANVIAWNWSWYILEPDPQKELISLLPKDVILQGDFERGGSKNVLGKRLKIDEYSFSYTGPSPRFKKLFHLAKKHGMRVTAKLQLSTTHELVTVPYIPVPYIIAEKIKRLRNAGADGYLGCWIFGGNISVMSKVAGKMSVNPSITPAHAVRESAVEEFGQQQSCYVTKAWKMFSSAWKNYPFSIPFLYFSPINYATAYPLTLDAKTIPGIPSWLPLPKDKNGHLLTGDNLKVWIVPFSAGFAIKSFRKLLAEWEIGIEILEKGTINQDSPRYRKELDMAVHISLLVQSTINIIQFYGLLKKYRKNVPGAKVNLCNLLKKELSIVEQDREIIKRNPDFGYHPEAHTHLIKEEDIDYKISLLKKYLKTL